MGVPCCCFHEHRAHEREGGGRESPTNHPVGPSESEQLCGAKYSEVYFRKVASLGLASLRKDRGRFAFGQKTEKKANKILFVRRIICVSGI